MIITDKLSPEKMEAIKRIIAGEKVAFPSGPRTYLICYEISHADRSATWNGHSFITMDGLTKADLDAASATIAGHIQAKNPDTQYEDYAVFRSVTLLEDEK